MKRKKKLNLKVKLGREQERLILIGVLLLVLVATTVYRDFNKNNTQNNTADAVELATTEDNRAKLENMMKKVNFLVADNKQVKITLVDIKSVHHQVYGDSIDVRFVVTNKDKKTLTVRAEEIRADGKKLDKSTVIMSTDIPAGETGEAILTIMEYEDHRLPAMERSFEMVLNIFSWEDLDFEQNHKFLVNL